jgi:hypothetical protein
LLALNDHLLKGWPAVPGWLSGKLSDFAGLFYFPLLLTALANSLASLGGWVRGRPPPARYPLTRGQLLLAILATAFPFVAIKLSVAAAGLLTLFADLLDGGARRPVADPTDLLALVMLPLAYLHGRRFVEKGPSDQ